MKTNIRQVNIKNRKLVAQLNELLSDTEYYFEYEYRYNKDDKVINRECLIYLYTGEGEFLEVILQYYTERKRKFKSINLEKVLTNLYCWECYESTFKSNNLAIYQASIYRTIHDTILYGKDYKRIDSKIKQVGETVKRLKI